MLTPQNILLIKPSHAYRKKPVALASAELSFQSRVAFQKQGPDEVAARLFIVDFRAFWWRKNKGHKLRSPHVSAKLLELRPTWKPGYERQAQRGRDTGGVGKTNTWASQSAARVWLFTSSSFQSLLTNNTHLGPHSLRPSYCLCLISRLAFS